MLELDDHFVLLLISPFKKADIGVCIVKLIFQFENSASEAWEGVADKWVVLDQAIEVCNRACDAFRSILLEDIGYQFCNNCGTIYQLRGLDYAGLARCIVMGGHL